jgi:hypothetical protein
MKKTLELTDKEALNIYPNAPQELKTILELNWGKPFFSRKITDRINSYYDACSDQGITPLTIDHFNFLPEQDRRPTSLFHQHTVIIRSLNEGWAPDWANHNEYKYEPRFKKTGGAGFGFSSAGTWAATSAVGSRLYLRTEELAKHFGEIAELIGIE